MRFQYRVLLSGAWNSVCCLPTAGNIYDADEDSTVFEQPRRHLLGGHTGQGQLYTDEREGSPGLVSVAKHRIPICENSYKFVLKSLESNKLVFFSVRAEQIINLSMSHNDGIATAGVK